MFAGSRNEGMAVFGRGVLFCLPHWELTIIPPQRGSGLGFQATLVILQLSQCV